MGKQLLCKGIIIGAVAGGLITLFDEDTRRYASRKLSESKDSAGYYVKHPSDALNQFNHGYQKASKQISAGLSSVLSILNQLEEVTNSVEDKSEAILEESTGASNEQK